jgi:hypothetical protein
MNAAIPERRPATEEISGLIERVTFHNDDRSQNGLPDGDAGHGFIHRCSLISTFRSS